MKELIRRAPYARSPDSPSPAAHSPAAARLPHAKPLPPAPRSCPSPLAARASSPPELPHAQQVQPLAAHSPPQTLLRAEPLPNLTAARPAESHSPQSQPIRRSRRRLEPAEQCRSRAVYHQHSPHAPSGIGCTASHLVPKAEERPAQHHQHQKYPRIIPVLSVSSRSVRSDLLRLHPAEGSSRQAQSESHKQGTASTEYRTPPSAHTSWHASGSSDSSAQSQDPGRTARGSPRAVRSAG